VTAGAIAQNVETLREFIRRLPNGLTYDAALVQWMQQHQAEQGVVKNVIDLLASNLVSNGDAQVTAIQIKAAIDALNAPVVPPVSPTVTAHPA
jgi:hypothetical protein